MHPFDLQLRMSSIPENREQYSDAARHRRDPQAHKV